MPQREREHRDGGRLPERVALEKEEDVRFHPAELAADVGRQRRRVTLRPGEQHRARAQALRRGEVR